MTRSTAFPPVTTSAGIWIMLLAGPTIWFVYFWAVYLIAESVCMRGGLDFEIIGMPGLSFVTVAITVAASALIILAGLRSRSVWKQNPAGTGRVGLALASFVLSGISFVAVLATGLPALGLEPC